MTQAMINSTLEKMIGRQPTDLELKAVEQNQFPAFSVGDKVKRIKSVIAGKVTAVVLFHVPQVNAYTWAVQIEGDTDFYPQMKYELDIG